MLRRLLVTGIAAIVCLFLLFLENKCSSFLGTQEVQAEVKPVESDPAAKEHRYDIVFKDVAGNVLNTTKDDLDEVKRRLAGNPHSDLKPITLVSQPVDSG